ncbi:MULTISPECIES: hypothetical protein [unclassified Methanoculleus]|jgi:hypothetical protein|uniref:hypothetical protein n=1 Tax=unclassified Methanoculleus TaxID=2619537 RepID=UPI0025EB6812|nr:hypothetical protein [Methanoculleus sp. UBA377]MDD2473296.1 hypothetical protein [Methanoculleus sp.]
MGGSSLPQIPCKNPNSSSPGFAAAWATECEPLYRWLEEESAWWATVSDEEYAAGKTVLSGCSILLFIRAEGGTDPMNA